MNEIIDRGRATNNYSLTYENTIQIARTKQTKNVLQLDRGEENSKFFVR